MSERHRCPTCGWKDAELDLARRLAEVEAERDQASADRALAEQDRQEAQVERDEYKRSLDRLTRLHKEQTVRLAGVEVERDQLREALAEVLRVGIDYGTRSEALAALNRGADTA